MPIWMPPRRQRIRRVHEPGADLHVHGAHHRAIEKIGDVLREETRRQKREPWWRAIRAAKMSVLGERSISREAARRIGARWQTRIEKGAKLTFGGQIGAR